MVDRIADLECRLAAVERRLSTLENSSRKKPTQDELPSLPALGEGFLSNSATHLGRVLLIFGGAYLLRAITDFQFVPTGFGVFLGATYALLWTYMAYRASGKKNQLARALFYGVASIFLALPLLVEATTRFAILSGPQGVLALTVFCILVLWVAALRNLRSLGWLITVGGMATAVVLLKTTSSAVPIAIFLLILGQGSLWIAYTQQLKGPQWLGGIGADAGAGILILLSTSDRWSIEPLTACLFSAVLMVLFLASFTLRSHVQHHDVSLFETVQGITVIGIMILAANKAAQFGQLNLNLAGTLSLLLGAGAYALAFTPQTRSTRNLNYLFYSTLGLALVIIGSALLVSLSKAAFTWSLMAIVMAWYSGRYGRVTLSLQCMLLLIAAGIGSGILSTCFQAFAGNTLESWPPVLPWHLIAALATLICLFIPVAQHSDSWSSLAGLPQLVVLTLSVCEVGGLLVVYLAPLLAGVPGSEANAGILATLRTAVLCASSVTLAFSSRYKRWPEARWLAYPVLILVGIKLVFEDFPNGQPVTLFATLVMVGGALILVSKLMTLNKFGTS